VRGLTDHDVEAAFDWLRENASVAAKARAERIYVEEYLRVVKATIMKEHGSIPVAAQEREALADERYAAHLTAIKEAVFADERIRFLREAAIAKIDAWRSASANERVRI
jgi:hypothetical protein